MKLDPAALRYLSDDDFRVLTAVEMGMRNHELVPIPLISAISGLRHGGYSRALKQIHKNKLVHKETKRYVGYRLTNLGYDYLALRALVKRGVIDAVGRSIGVGKEADVFVAAAAEALQDEVPEIADAPHVAVKLHRLGRTSFRAVKTKRDYLVHRRSASWIYFSRLAAMKEYAFMCALHERGFPVPRPVGQSRHVVVMELCQGLPLTQIRELEDPVSVGNELLEIVVRFAQYGLVHCDFNQFNIMIDDEEAVTVIDFPQMVSTSHPDATALFDRDVNGVRRFFCHRFGLMEDQLILPVLTKVIAGRGDEEQLDTMVAASGFKNVSSHSQYGVQDLGESDNTDGDEILDSIDMTSLQLALPDARNTEPVEEKDAEVTDELRQSEQDANKSQDHDTQSEESTNAFQQDYQASASSINHTLIQSRVRRQRANQSKRRQMARRNVVKDSEKRKVKVEIKSGIWD